MYSAVIYESCTGSCRKYAELISEELGIPVYSLKDAPADSENKVIFVGWLFAGKVVGYKKAKEKFMIGALLMVGMSMDPAADCEWARKPNKVPAYTSIFCAQGAFHMSKLPPALKLAMKLKCPSIVKKLEKLEAKEGSLSEVHQATLEMAMTGEGEPYEWNIDRIVEFCR